MILLLKFSLGCCILHLNPDLDIWLPQRPPKTSFRESNTKRATQNVLFLLRDNNFKFEFQGAQQETELQLVVQESSKSTKRLKLGSVQNKLG